MNVFPALTNVPTVHEAEKNLFYTVINEDQITQFCSQMSWTIVLDVSNYSDYIFNYTNKDNTDDEGVEEEEEEEEYYYED